MEIETPVIFTTAYDEYAIEAFRVNSIDYLLKPIKTEDLKRALEKFKKITRQDLLKYITQVARLAPGQTYRDKLLIPDRDKLKPVDIGEVSCFYTTDKNTKVCLKTDKWYSYPGTLEQIEATLNPTEFIRANKQFIVARDSVKNITIWFDSRLLVTLDVETPERIYVSKNKAAEFKAWLVRKS
ncbi:MAG: LytTR family DNA-binding domain-containing protein, partial [Bacteroidales bacterium]|jgi:DNA-binding LytR/AlgR family response regulator|nr:LytTR family DNA-binding domain-containing protein [Bacteroidales bacterium]